MANAAGDSIFDQLIRAAIDGAGGGRANIFPIFAVGVMAAGQQPAPADQIMLVNPATQGMVVLRGDPAILSELLSGGGVGGGTERPPAASKDSIESLPTVAVAAEEDEDCAVCLDSMAPAAKEMPCGHRYHEACIGKWLRLNGNCPACRYRMPEEEGKGEGTAAAGEETEEHGERMREREVWITVAIGQPDRSDGNGQEQRGGDAMDLD